MPNFNLLCISSGLSISLAIGITLNNFSLSSKSNLISSGKSVIVNVKEEII